MLYTGPPDGRPLVSAAMIVESTALPDVKLIVPRRFADDRGAFAETYHKARLAETGIAIDFVQDNCSVSRMPGTIRGFHFQRSPAAQAKLVQVVRGGIVDVAVDIRHGSPSFGRYVAVELSADNGHQLFIPTGFAHAFCTVRPDTVVIYKVDAYYAPETEGGIRWDDPDLAISWPLGGREPLLSPRDRALPRLRELAREFIYAPH